MNNEDIKVLKNIINELKGETHYLLYTNKEKAQAIENLIKGYKDLEKVCKAQANKINDYEEWIKVGMIPKSKIEEIRDKAEVMDYYTLPNVIEDLNKVLGEGDK